MKIGILFDIHGNIDVLRSAVKVLADTDKILHGGDLIGWGTEPGKVIDAIREYGIEGISGNHELLVRSVYKENHISRNISTSWTQGRVSEEQLGFIGGLPSFIQEESFYLFHATPNQNKKTPNFPYLKKAEDFLPFISDISAANMPLILLGHVHIPACYSVCTKSNTIETISLPSSLDGYQVLYKSNPDKITIIVGGSLGWSRSGKKVFTFIVDEECGTVTFREVPYNIDAYRESMEKEKYPTELKNIFEMGLGKT